MVVWRNRWCQFPSMWNTLRFVYDQIDVNETTIQTMCATREIITRLIGIVCWNLSSLKHDHPSPHWTDCCCVCYRVTLMCASASVLVYGMRPMTVMWAQWICWTLLYYLCTKREGKRSRRCNIVCALEFCVWHLVFDCCTKTTCIIIIIIIID